MTLLLPFRTTDEPWELEPKSIQSDPDTLTVGARPMTLHSVKDGSPLDPSKPYKDGPHEALNKHAIATKIETKRTLW